MTQNKLTITPTSIDGLLVVNLPLHGDKRGWFKEHWQREKMVHLGLPDFAPVQQNISFNSALGTTRGIHAEPWDKYVSVANGSAFGAWVDLREGPGFGRKFTIELTPERAVFVPRGVANSFQTLEPNTAYMYLVNDHWSPQAQYTFVNLADPELDIAWPIPLSQATVSEKDMEHPYLADVSPVRSKETVVIGAGGQLGRALRDVLSLESARFVDRPDIDLSSTQSIEGYDWDNVDVIINAAAYTAVDQAETPEGRRTAWQVNATALGTLAKIANKHRATLVTVSTDYVFDGTVSNHTEQEEFTPQSVYGQTKAAGEIASRGTPQHYIVRTSWVVGEGNNFVRTMAKLAHNGVNPKVVDDQFGRLTFASELARGIKHLLDTNAPFGTYNLSGSGEITSWFTIATEVFKLLDHDPNRVTPVPSKEYELEQTSLGKTLAPRPMHSAFDLSKIEATGFQAEDHLLTLKKYLLGE